MRNYLLISCAVMLFSCGSSESDDGRGGAAGATLDAGSEEASFSDVPVAVDGPEESSHPKSSICEIYIACTADTIPAGLGTILATYGEDGSCWAVGDASLCESACRVGVIGAHKAFPGTPSCNYCESSSDCPYGLPACDTSAKRCVGCVQDSDCPSSDTPACDLSTHSCVGCLSDFHCAGASPACDTAAHQCVRCLTDAHCPPNAPRCDSRTCFECVEDKDCEGSSQGRLCLPMLRRCGCGLFGGGCEPGQLCESSTCCTPDCWGKECGPSFTLGCGNDNENACGICPNKGTCHQGVCSDIGVVCDPASSKCASGERCSFTTKTKDYRCLKDAVGSSCNNEYVCHVAAGGEGAYVCVQSVCLPFCQLDTECPSGKCEVWYGPISPTSPGVCAAS